MARRSKGEKVFGLFNVVLLGVLGLLTLYPFLYTVSMSVSTQAEASKSDGLEGLHVVPNPDEMTLASYEAVFNNPNLWVGYGNTVFRTVVGTLATLVVTCMAAYPLSRKEMPHRGALTFLVLFTMIFTGGLVPLFLLITGIGLYNSLLVYILPILLTAFNVIVVKNFFQSLPDSIYEAATIDGASEWRILFGIFMPLSKPVLATITLWTAVIHWNMWFDAMIYVDDNSKQVMQTFLQRIVIEGNTELIEKGLINPDDVKGFNQQTIKSATTVVTILPILVLYPFVQKYFVKGILLGSVKG